MKQLIMIGLLICLMFGCESNAGLEENNLSQQVEELEQEVTQYDFPHENDEHEGTWLQWPHDHTYEGIIQAYESTWIEMTRALVKGENVHLIVYDETEKNRVENVLISENIDMTKVDFFIHKTNDVWTRDNGPIFVYDDNGHLHIQNWQFNGWGNKVPYNHDDKIPQLIGKDLNLPVIHIDMVMEGGALEFDGNGTCFSTLSCVNNDNRTADYTLEEIENYLRKYYGAEKFVWLNGIAGMDITDNHIDGIIKCVDDKTILVEDSYDLDPNTLDDDDDAKILLTATNANDEPYDFVFLPSTKEAVVQIDGEWIKGSYLNFYVGNAVVLVPNYNDENDQIANAIIQSLYPDREVVGINAINLFADGGMIHCVTQQQPININK